MLYSFNRRKLGALPTQEVPTLIAACCQIEDSSPWFDHFRRYLIPLTPEERLAELISDFELQLAGIEYRFRAKSLELKKKAVFRFDRNMDAVARRLAALDPNPATAIQSAVIAEIQAQLKPGGLLNC